jgi:flavin reductase (DIM6/NTAB) family NADH-FMN oxidoreductase RutF
MEDQKFRDLMALVPAPVTVITTYDEDGPHGTTVSAFTSLSLNPKLVMVSMDNNSRILRRIRHTRHLGINLLGEGQGDLAMRFARDETLRFVPSDWRLEGERQMPRLDDTAAWIEASLAYELPAGDHTILACEVIDAEMHGPLAIVYSNRVFGANGAASDR